MDFENLLFEKREEVAVITINRPHKMNALNRATLQELDTAVTEIERDGTIHAVVLTGAGEKAFIAGADIAEIADMDRESGKQYAEFGQMVFNRIENLHIPVIAAVNGFALGGGCELAMACHFRIAASSARFGQPEVNLGLIPGFGGTQRLARLAGKGRAMELCLSGDMIDAVEAQRIGLVNSLVEANQLLDKTLEIAASLAKKAPLAVKAIISSINRGLDTDLPSALGIEAGNFGEICNTSDMAEGTKAFLEKRKADFKGS